MDSDVRESEGERRRVLIVDDDPVIRNLYITKFENAGFSATALPDIGEDIVERVIAEAPHLILLDIDFAGKSTGLDAADKLLADPRTAAIKIAYLTNFERKEDKVRAQNQKIQAYFIKSNFTPAQVVEEVKRLIH